jgi:fructose transport system permease protein
MSDMNTRASGSDTALPDVERVPPPGEPNLAAFDSEAKGPIRRVQHFLHATPTAIPALVLALSALVFAAIVGARFFAPFNLSLILQQVTVIGVVGVAQTIVILTAGIDLSVGAILVLCSVIMGQLAVVSGVSPLVAVALGIGAGGLMGFINGALVTFVRLPPFIVTLGTWNIFFAVNLWYSHSETIRSQDIEATAPLLQVFGDAVDLPGVRLTMGSLFMIGLSALFWYLLNWTPWGRHVHAVGDDPESARLAGIRTKRTLISVYVVAGTICAFAGWVLIGRIGSVSPQAGQTANLDSITAVVIGGTSLFGGRGSIIGTLLGALIVGVFRNGLALSGVEVLWQDFAVGLLSIVAVTIDQWLRRVSA